MTEFFDNIKLKKDVGLEVTTVTNSDNAVINKKYFSEKLDEFHSLSSTKDFSEQELPSISNTIVDTSKVYEVTDIVKATEDTNIEALTSSETNEEQYILVLKDTYYMVSIAEDWLPPEDDLSFDEISEITKETINKTLLFVDSNNKQIKVHTICKQGFGVSFNRTTCVTTFEYVDGSAVPDSLQLYSLLDDSKSIYYKVIDPDNVGVGYQKDASVSYTPGNTRLYKFTGTAVTVNLIIGPADNTKIQQVSVQSNSFYSEHAVSSGGGASYEALYALLPELQKYTSGQERAMRTENNELVFVHTTLANEVYDSTTFKGLRYVTTIRYAHRKTLKELPASLTLYPTTEIYCYDFENLEFSTQAEGNLLLSEIYSYVDEWGNRCYTISPDYTPNMEGQTAVNLFDTDGDPENMLYSIKLEALYNSGYKYSLGNKEFSYLGGTDVIADGNGAFASGQDSYAIGNSANTLGRLNKVRAQSGVALGYNNTVTGRHGVALNEGNKVLGYAALGAGDHNTVGGAYDIVSGWQNKTRGSANIVQGSKNNVNAELTLCQGSTNDVEGNTLANFGNHNVVRGGFSIVQGYKNNTDGQYLAVTGNNNTVTGVSNIVTGGSNIVTGEGYNGVVGATNRINGSENFVVGYKNNVSAVRAIVSGASNIVETGSNYSLVVGMSNITKSRFANAIGAGLTADGSYSQLVVGRNNVVESDAHFIVGNGVTTDSKSNAFVVHYDGRATVGKNPERSMDVSTKYYVDSKTSGLASKSYVDTQIANNIGSSVFVGSTAPEGTHKLGTLWIDTSENDGGLKYYNGSAWVTVPVRFS